MTGKMFKDGDINFATSNAISEQDGYLEGQLLVATPAVMGEFFTQSVIYMFAHNAGGAMGVVLNKPLDMVHYASLFQQLDIDVSARNRDLTVYHGGPVEENRGFVIHSSDYETEDTLAHDCGISVTASLAILRDLADGKGPKNALLTVGYAGWSAGQLEAEIEANSWITVPATQGIIFHEDNDAKHSLAAKSLGIDMMRFSPVVGHA